MRQNKKCCDHNTRQSKRSQQHARQMPQEKYIERLIDSQYADKHILRKIREFYQDPQNVTAFQEWLKARGGSTCPQTM